MTWLQIFIGSIFIGWGAIIWLVVSVVMSSEDEQAWDTFMDSETDEYVLE